MNFFKWMLTGDIEEKPIYRVTEQPFYNTLLAKGTVPRIKKLNGIWWCIYKDCIESADTPKLAYSKLWFNLPMEYKLKLVDIQTARRRIRNRHEL